MRVNPEQIENLNLEDEFDFEAMLNESEKKNEGGKIQEGVIVRIDKDYAMVAVNGAKQEGRLPISEITNEAGELFFKEGDKIEVYVSPSYERLNISHKKVLKMRKLEEKIQEIKDCFENLVVNCKILKKNKGGYIVEFDGVEAFLPKRESALKEDARNIGKVIKATVMSVSEGEKTIVVSRKKYLEVAEQKREETIKKLLEDDRIYEGIVSKITSFGMFVDVEGVDGLVHYTEISHKGPVNPATVANVGDKICVKVLGFDSEKKRLSYSVKATIEDPWKEIKDQLEVGDTIRVRVGKIENYGAFVDLGNGTEGFLHISEISWDKQIKHPADILEENQQIDVEIIEIDPEKKRLRVSLKKMMPKPFSEFTKRVKVGDILEGKVVKLVEFGVFVNVGEIDGLLHNEDFSWDKQKTSKDLKVGDTLCVKVIKIDPAQEKISLSARALEESPVDRFAQSYGIDSIVSGRVVDVKDFGVFIALQEGVEALIRDGDLYPLKKEEIKNDDLIEAVVVYIDRQQGKVRASVKRLERIKEREQLNQYNSDSKMTLGDLLKQRK